ncbi:MAG: glycoside hydrolase family 38 C-terminal domain-containing protein [Cyclobacteriaceae bacterium]
MQFFRPVTFSLLILLIAAHIINAQNSRFLNGYQTKISGDEIPYHAPDPRATKALLIRSQDSTNVIQWKSSVVPENYSQQNISFVWMFGMDASSEQHNFVLSANGIDLVEFSNPSIAQKDDVMINGNNGSSLRFRITKIDRNKDVMGYAIFTMPAKLTKSGEPVLFQARGESAGSNIWYMTFKYPIENELTVKSQPVLNKRDDKNVQAVLVELVNLDDSGKVSIHSNDQEKEYYDVEPGYNAFKYFVPETKTNTELPVHIKIGDAPVITKTCKLKPVRPWTIYFVQHTHTDIGYTRPQSEILPEHLRFIDYALEYCDLTDDYPDDAKFRWTCESSWAVEQYLLKRPDSKVNKLLERIKEGRIEVTGMLFNMSEIADETSLKNLLNPLSLFHKYGIDVQTAMQDDVNGIGWCMADYLPDAGVKYLIMGEHGHRALIPFDKPTSFWWQSPSGKKMLAFRGEHYMHGNALLIHTGDLDNFKSNLLNYLTMLEENEYPFDHLALQYSGYVTDNSPPALAANKVIKEWNEQYLWPRLRSATASEFMEYIDTHHGDELETYQKAWPDWWTDGFGSAARETAAIREAQTEMNVTTGLLAMSTAFGEELKPGIFSAIDQIYRNILFYDEHTFGAAESISHPYSENSMVQWAEKSSYAWEALKESRILREEAFGLLQEHVPRFNEPSITVFNTLNQTRSGLVSLYIDHEIIEPGSNFSINYPDGKHVPVQSVSSRSDGTHWVLWVKDVPPMGYRSLIIKTEEGKKISGMVEPFQGEFENDHWSVILDPETGSISSLVDKARQKEMVDTNSEWKPGQLIYERLSNRRQLELYTLREEPKRTSLTNVSFDKIERGSIWTAIHVQGYLEDCSDVPVKIEYRFYNEEPLIEINYSLIKNPVVRPEALYVGFPFMEENGEIVFEAQGGAVRPGKDQLAGTSSDWNTVQNYVSIRSEEGQILIVSPEIPLFHLGGLNIGNFSYHHDPVSNHVYSWVLNNYWTTNFRASQEGNLSWRYFLTSTDDPGIQKASDFGWQSMIPLTGRVFPEGRNDQSIDYTSILKREYPGLLMVNVMPSNKDQGIIFQFREIAGETIEFIPDQFFNLYPNAKWTEVNVVGEHLRDINDNINIKPNSVHFLQVSWNKTTN